MQQINSLIVCSTSRVVREKLTTYLQTNSILPKIITIGDFEKKVVFVPNRFFIDEDSRVLLLKEASQFTNFKNLHISREFFAFLKNSQFLFSFFEELAGELIEIKDLKKHDVYDAYHEHLEILERLLLTYHELLNKNNYVDKILLPSLYRLNMAYLKNVDLIEFYLDGYLSNFEFQLFDEISSHKPFVIKMWVNQFNQKMVEKFAKFDISLELGYYYEIDFSDKKIIKKEKHLLNQTFYQSFSSNSQTLQVAFIKKMVFDFIKKGIEAEKIAVIFPDGKFSQSLSLFNSENSFNFAMGSSFVDTPLYQKLSALYEYFLDPKIENYYRLKRYKYDRDIAKKKTEDWNRSVDDALGLKNKILSLVDEEESEAYRVFKEELTLFVKIFNAFIRQPFHKILHLFLNRLGSKRIDDVGGGKVTVMEILESRGMSYDGVIVVDFNESLVPLRSQKDLFLSTEIRSFVGLPTPSDRENLQKYYYKRVFEQAQEVAISYVENEQNQPSRFLDELDLNIKKIRYENHNFHDILFSPKKQKEHFLPKDIEMEYDFGKVELSATRVKTYLDCKRRYYLRYIRGIEEASLPSDESDERMIGILLHSALKELFEERVDIGIGSASELFDALKKILYQKSEKEILLKFHIDIWLKKLYHFCQVEFERFRVGYRILQMEKKLTLKYNGFTLVGNIDRVDIKDDRLFVIDYKSGKIPKVTSKSLSSNTEFQLQFYTLLASSLGKVEGAYFYDLSHAKLVDEPLFDEKMEILDTHLDSLKDKNQNFTMSEDIKKCQYCPYVKICDRVG